LQPVDGISYAIFLSAQMAELVDAADSKSAVRKDVQVRFLFWAQHILAPFGANFFI
jgi:hypothetical protein